MLSASGVVGADGRNLAKREMQSEICNSGRSTMAKIGSQQVHFGTPSAPGPLISIQYLRGFAALSVLAAHALKWPLSDVNFGLLKTGRLGVEVFFVISGFIITMIAGDGRFDPRDFLARRIFRIVPAYWVATLVVAILAIAIPSQFRTTVPTIDGLAMSLLFVPSVDPKAPLLLLGWTLDYEAFFYAIFASLFFLKSEARTLVVCAVLALLVWLGQVMTEPTHLQAFYTSASLIGFGFGTLLAQAYRHGLVERLGGAMGRALAAAAVILVALFYGIDWDNTHQLSLPLHVLMSVTAVSIVLLGLQIEATGRLPEVTMLKYLGDTSYSLYLFHLFPVAAVWAVSKRLFDVDEPLTYLACSALAIVAGVLSGLVCYYLVERPFLNASRKWNRPAAAVRLDPVR